ncbi:MAG: MFS transporter, partial [Coriobacteriales bacterium]|nr:MFS transporter [Coriobacteriales bacterium]
MEKLRKNSGYAWLIVAVTYFASFMAPMNQFKIPPVADAVIPAFGMDPVTFGWLMSSISIIGVLLAFPTVFIVRKIGLKGTTLLAVACLCIGSLLGALFDSLAVLFVGRFIEGFGIGLLGVSAPAAITVWFDADKRGLPLGVWATWFPVGTVIMFNIGPAIGAALGWKSLWWLCAICCAIAFILFLLIYRLPSANAEEEVTITASPLECLKVLKNRNIWLLGVSFGCWNLIILGCINSFYNQYLGEAWGMDPQMASTVTSILTAIALVLMPILGFVTDRVKRRKPFVVFSFFCILAGSFFAFIGAGNMVILVAFIAISGLGMALAGAASRPIAPEIMPATALGATMGM